MLESLALGGKGLEPLLCYQLDPKSSASANSATRPSDRVFLRITRPDRSKEAIPLILKTESLTLQPSRQLQQPLLPHTSFYKNPSRFAVPQHPTPAVLNAGHRSCSVVSIRSVINMDTLPAT
jgi:hypothetical protein